VRVALAVILAVCVPVISAAPAAAATKTFRPAKGRGDVATFAFKGLHRWAGDPPFTGERQMLVDWVRVSRL
jgi:hypothetical protein